jgi:hypothetical protein
MDFNTDLSKEIITYFKSKSLDELIEENFDGLGDFIDDPDTLSFYKDLIKEFTLYYSESIKK